MLKNNKAQKILAPLGTVLVLLPILFMLLTAVVGSLQRRQLLCDYMLPAELSLLVLAGCGLLLWAALRARTFIRAIAWTTGASFVLLIGCQALAMVTGLAHGRVEVEDAPGWVAIITVMLLGYDLGVALLGYWGVRLSLKIYNMSQNTTMEENS